MLYKTPQNIDTKVLSYAKQELAEQHSIDFLLYFKYFINIFSNVFLSNYKNLYLKIINSKEISFKQSIIDTLCDVIGFILPVSIISFQQVKISNIHK